MVPSTALIASTAPGVQVGRPTVCTRKTGRPTAKANDTNVRPRFVPTKPRNGRSRSTLDQPVCPSSGTGAGSACVRCRPSRGRHISAAATAKEAASAPATNRYPDRPPTATTNPATTPPTAHPAVRTAVARANHCSRCAVSGHVGHQSLVGDPEDRVADLHHEGGDDQVPHRARRTGSSRIPRPARPARPRPRGAGRSDHSDRPPRRWRGSARSQRPTGPDRSWAATVASWQRRTTARTG